MRKTILAAGSAILALALAATALATSAFKQTASVGFTGHHPGASTGIAVDFRSTDSLAPAGKPKQATRIVIAFPSTTRFNLGTSAVSACHVPDKQLMDPNAQFPENRLLCPSSSQVGSGTATLNTMPMGTGPIRATVKVFRHAGRTLYIMVFTSMKDLPGSWQPWILRATASGSNLTIKVPAQIYGKGRCKPVACLPQGIHASLTMLRFTTTPAGAGSDALVRSGSCTAGRFKVSSKFTYTDRSTARVTSSSRCSA